MYEITRMPANIEIGYTGEKGFRTIEIDMAPWMEILPNGVPSIVHIRPGETEADAYIAATTFEDNILRWTISAGDLGETEGTGLAQIWLEESENNSVNKRGKSVLVATIIRQALNDASETPPEAQEAWLEQMTALKVATVNAAGDAEDSAEDSEAWAVGKRDGVDVETTDPAYHNNSKYYSQQASGSATDAGNAKTAAEAAKDAAIAATAHYPYVDTTTGNWMVWDASTGAFVNTGVHAQGPQGEEGPAGADGQDGADGDDAYVYIRYAANQPTQDSDMKTTPDEWMGIYSGASATAPTTYTSYTWYKIKGETGSAENVRGDTIPMSQSDSTKVDVAITSKANFSVITGDEISNVDIGEIYNNHIGGIARKESSDSGTSTTVGEEINKLIKSVASLAIMIPESKAPQAIPAGKFVIIKNDSNVVPGIYQLKNAMAENDWVSVYNLRSFSDGILSLLNDNLGSPSSASDVTGDDAFSKINTLNSNLGNHVIRSFTKIGIAIADGSVQSPSFTTIDCSDYVPTGKVIYNAIVSVQSGTQWYVLPNMENDGVRYTVLERVGNTTVVIKNTEAGWGTTNVTITLFMK